MGVAQENVRRDTGHGEHGDYQDDGRGGLWWLQGLDLERIALKEINTE